MDTTHNEIVETYEFLTASFDGALLAWADATTNATSALRCDLLRDKVQAATGFFSWIGKPVELVNSADMKDWQFELEKRDLTPSTVYGMISRVSSFYNGAMKSPDTANRITNNPVTLARPKAPTAYQTESTKSLDDDELNALVDFVKTKATQDIVGKRDYAMLMMYITTGMRRQEVANLHWKDININGILFVTYHEKGGDIVTREVKAPVVLNVLLDYLEASDRLNEMAPDSPLWTRHDRAGKPGKALSSQAFAKNLKKYAESAGIGDIHLHQTRHSYGRITGEEGGSLTEVQEALGHKNLATTRVYVQRIGIRKDKFSSRVAERLAL